MVQSAHSFWPPRPLRMSPVDTFQHIGKLGRRDDDDTIGRRRPYELAALQSLCVKRHTETVVPKNFDQIATTAAKGACGSRCSACCTCSARPFMPRRMSVWPVEIHTRTPE